MGLSRSFWNDTTSALQPKEVTSKGTRVSCVSVISLSISMFLAFCWFTSFECRFRTFVQAERHSDVVIEAFNVGE